VLPRAEEPILPALQLFSTSMDRNVMIWEPDASTRVWTPVVRIGDVGGTLGGTVGGNLLGFVGGCMAPCGRALLGVGYGGQLHLWHEEGGMRDRTNYCRVETGAGGGGAHMGPCATTSGAAGRWHPRPCLSGHFGQVADVCWSADGKYLASVSSDETCRVWSLVPADKSGALVPSSAPLWREVARPSIHGYDLTRVALCPQPASYLLYMGSSEKTIRVLDASTESLKGLRDLCGVPVAPAMMHSTTAAARSSSEGGAAGATTAPRVGRAFSPELALTNKAADLMSADERADIESRGVPSLQWTQPPLQGQLADYTLWPETATLYGHTNDVTALALSSDGAWLATACKARDPKAAVVLVWNTAVLGASAAAAFRLEGHDSTVVTLSFDSSGCRLASAGKDRTLCVHRRTWGGNTTSSSDSGPFEGWVQVKSAHKRIIWGVAWLEGSGSDTSLVSAAGPILLTSSRDGLCKLWSHKGENAKSFACVHSINAFGGAAVTAVAGTWSAEFGAIVALGSGDGHVQLWRVDESKNTGEGGDEGQGEGQATLTSACVGRTTRATQHAAAVRRVLFRPRPPALPPLPPASGTGTGMDTSPTHPAELMSCADDFSLKHFVVAL
jgi:elongator complex protein 2